MTHFIHIRSRRGGVTRMTKIIEEETNRWLSEHPEEVKRTHDKISEAHLNLILYGTTERPATLE